MLSQEIIQKENNSDQAYVLHFQEMIDQIVVKINDLLIRNKRKNQKFIHYETMKNLFKSQEVLLQLGNTILRTY